MSYPPNYLLLLNDRFPLLWIPLKLCCFFISNTWRTTDEDDTGLVPFLNFNKSQHKDIGIATNEALNGEISKLSLGVGANFVVFGFDEVEDDV